jgi:uncharacterized damage-inducible protein DinB
MPEADPLRNALVQDIIVRLYDESLPRILKCLDQLDNEQVWWRPNESSNSIGNLVLHLNGNVNQWICAGLGSFPDNRQRQAEFDERKIIDKQALADLLKDTMKQVKSVIEGISEVELLRIRKVQTFEASGVSILIHVTEHFSYHTGQIAYITKMLMDKSLGFYDGIKLE